jgi:hypothetical protein
MRSSSTEQRGFWPGDAGAWARLALVVTLGVGALVAPAVGVGKTGAIYTDTETVGFDVGTSAPPATPSPTDSTSPTADPTATPTADPTTAPVVAAPAALSILSGGVNASPTPQATATATTGRGHAHTPGPVGPAKP